MEYRLCVHCKINKPLTEFNKNKLKKDGINTYCKLCKYITTRESRKKCRSELGMKIIEYLYKNPCCICGESDPLVLDFDHLDQETKTKSISDLVNIASKWTKIESEIKKCRVLCKNCHYRWTAVQLDHPRIKLLKLAIAQ